MKLMMMTKNNIKFGGSSSLRIRGPLPKSMTILAPQTQEGCFHSQLQGSAKLEGHFSLGQRREVRDSAITDPSQ